MATTKFKPNEFNIAGESSAVKEFNIQSLDKAASLEVKEFAFPQFGRGKAVQTPSVKVNASGVMTGVAQSERSQKDLRFAINPLLKKPLSIEEEEEDRIELEVQKRLQEQLKILQQKAEKEGHEAGLKKGFEESFKKNQQESLKNLEQFEAMVNEFEGAKAKVVQANERFIMEAVFRIARMLFLKEVAADPEYVARLTRQLIDSLGVRENIKVRLNPEDFKMALQLKEGLEKTLGGLKNLDIESSSQVERGGCLVETEWNAIDASFESQLKGIHEALVGQKA